MEGAGVKEAEVVGVALAGLAASVDGTVWGTVWEIVCILVPLLPGDSKFKTLPFFRGVEDRTEDSWLIISVSCSGLLSLASRFWILARKQITGTINVSKFRNCCINVVAQIPPSVRDPRPTEPPVFREEKLVSHWETWCQRGGSSYCNTWQMEYWGRRKNTGFCTIGFQNGQKKPFFLLPTSL